MTGLGVTVGMVMIVIAICHVTTWAQKQREAQRFLLEEIQWKNDQVDAAMYRPTPLYGDRPAPEDIVTYEDRAKWLRPDIRKSIEDSLHDPLTDRPADTRERTAS